MGDIHIRKSIERHQEYREVFDRLYEDLKNEKPDRIVIGGDLYDNFIDIEGEALILAGEFLNNLSNIAKVIIVVGNHDIRKKHKTRVNTVETVTTLIDNTGVTYYNKSGFYEDENVTWVVWDHVDEINPWKHFKRRNTKDSFYIDIYHNPIDGCALYNGMQIHGKYPKISDFKGDISLLHDIHLRQFFKNRTKAYCGSLIQQHFGEFPENHGYLLWDIENGTVKEKNIHNDYKFINVLINKNTDYDNINIGDIEKSEKTKIKIKWEDFSVNMNTENERKLREVIKESVGTDLINIENRPLYTDINDSKILSESIDINDSTVQQNILREFLSRNDINEELIEKIIDIDNTVNDRLNIVKSKNVKWNIDKFWFNNFKSYGDKNIIDWKDKNGIIQIHGVNQQGKSTILDALCYIMYGTTLSTTKREKNGDNRYINVNRTKNHCDGGAIIDVDGEKYLIYRKTERKIKRTGEISSCSTKLEYYKGTEMKEENKLVGEKRVDTQKQLDSILGDFNDFIRLTLTNADNINDLLSMDRSVFIDNIIKDAGYDIFDKKLNEFKEYKKSLNLDKITINLSSINNDIKNLRESIKFDKERINQYDIDIKDRGNDIKTKRKDKEKLIGKLNKIDDEIIKINYDDLLENIEIHKNTINYDYQNISRIESEISQLPFEFENEKLSKKREWYDKYKDAISDVKSDINSMNNEISTKGYKLKEIENKISKKLDDIEKDIKDRINSYETEIKILNNDIKNIKRDGLKIKNQIDSLNNSNTETKTCPTCLKPINDNDTEHFLNEISKKKSELKELAIVGKNKKYKIEELNSKIEELNNINIVENEEYLTFVNDIKSDINTLENGINFLKEKVDVRKEKLKKAEPKIEEVKNEIYNLENEKNKFDKKLKLESSIKDIKIKINKNIEENNIRIDKANKYNENKRFIDENKEINSKIDEISNDIETLTKELDKQNNNLFEIKQNILLKEKEINDNNKKIEQFKKQEELDFIHSTYMKVMHRDGLPTFLLKKSIHIINNELNILLSNLDFNLLFDEDLNLKMRSKSSNKSYNAVEGSGMERVFNACVLKMSLRRINNTSKPNIILFDEVMNKLVDKSVDEFIELLYELKNHLDKIIIIEHIHQMKYDYLISVEKDKNGVSSFEIL